MTRERSWPMDDAPTIQSVTLRQVKALPETACVGCPNAVWHLAAKDRKEHLRVYCLLMHALIDDPLIQCDGTQIFPSQKNAS